MRKPSTVRKAVATVLVMAIAVTSLFASPLVPKNGFGDAKVYNINYNIVLNARAIAEGYIIQTANDPVVLENADAHVEVEANTLAVFMDLASNLKIYVLDGKVQAVSTSGDFSVMTAVTTYSAKSGSSVYVITDEKNEMGFIEDGSAQVRNYITGATTPLEKGSYIDNSISSFIPRQTTVSDFWGIKTPEAAVEKPQAVQPESSPLTDTFSYEGFKATITAYNGHAVLEYPTYVTDEEIATAAEAAFRAYPQFMTGIYYRIVEPGKVEFVFPESYGKDEFNLAVELLKAELPAYIASLMPPAEEPQELMEPEGEIQAATAEEIKPEEEPEAVTVKTPLETLPRPEEQEVHTAEKEENDFRFGLSAGAIWGAGKDGDTFTKFPYTGGRLGMFWKDFIVYARPYIQYKDFTFGLSIDVPFVDAKIDSSAFSFDKNHGITGYVNSIAKYISVIGYEKENFGIKAKLNTSLKLKSPIFKSNDWRYQGGQNLVGELYFKAGSFTFDAFADDLKLANKVNGKSQFAGFRAGYTFGDIDAGFSLVADYGKSVAKSKLYPSLDLSIPFSLSDANFTVDITGAAQLSFDDGFKIQGYMGQAIVNIAYGAIDVGIGGSYSRGSHFADQITNSPVTTDTFTNGSSIDAIVSMKLDTEIFDLGTSFRIPFNVSTQGLLRNTVKTRSGATKNLSADVFDIQMDFNLGSFTFILGGSSYGFTGKVGDLIQVLKDHEARRTAVLELISPDTSKFFAELDFKTGIGSGDLDVFLRADVDSVESKIRIPMSVGASYSF